MDLPKVRANDEAPIRELVHAWAAALRAKDVDHVLAHYAEDVVSFDLVPPPQCQGGEALKKSLAAWFPTFLGPIGFELRDLRIMADDAVAVCRSLNRISGTRTRGDQTDLWVRVTLVWRRVAGRWLISHEHASVPFYVDRSNRAAIDRKP
jgi:uncharacterized protein (TIGR02246 family)